MGLERFQAQLVCIEQRFVAVRVAALHSVAADFALEATGASGDLTTRTSLVGARPEAGTPRPVLFVKRRDGVLTLVPGARPDFDVRAESSSPLDTLCGPASRSMVGSWRRSIDELSHCLGLPGSDLFCDSEIAPDEWDLDVATVHAWIERSKISSPPGT